MPVLRSLHHCVRMRVGPGLVCSQCQRAVHTLCLAHPCLSALDLPQGCWVCPCCSQPNTLPVGPALPGPPACSLNQSTLDHCK